MSDKYYEDPLESLLDEQSDEEFGLPEIHNKYDHGARETQHGNLKTWTAEEFSSIYVRFYPHLVRHAKRYLSNEVQAEEVVQDAFLYMMTALPEIDTELGVLKFMKWKVRLLALDVIRATPNQRETLVDSFDDELSADVTDSEIERADDIAVIRAALAKLNPRHREALVATVYEEKSSVEVAAQMGLSDNAARQLVFRARSAFKKALVGEAEVAGKSVSEILSIAAKRAALGVKENSRTLSVVLLLAIGISWLPNLGSQLDHGGQLVAGSTLPEAVNNAESLSEPGDSSPATPEESETPVTVDAPEASNDLESRPSDENVAEAETESKETPVSSVSSGTDESVSTSETEFATQPATDIEDSSAEQAIVAVLGQTAGQGIVVEQSTEPNFQTNAAGIPMELRSNSGLQAFFFFNPETQEISNLVLRVEIDGKPFFGIPGQYGYGVSESASNISITHTSSAVSFVDQFGRVKNIPELHKMAVSIQVNLDALNRPMSSNLTVKLFS